MLLCSTVLASSFERHSVTTIKKHPASITWQEKNNLVHAETAPAKTGIAAPIKASYPFSN